jgi:hypothetical protein
MKRIIYLLLMFVIMFAMTGCKKKYTITFDSDGGTAFEAITLKKETSLPDRQTQSRKDMTFRAGFLIVLLMCLPGSWGCQRSA